MSTEVPMGEARQKQPKTGDCRIGDSCVQDWTHLPIGMVSDDFLMQSILLWLSLFAQRKSPKLEIGGNCLHFHMVNLAAPGRKSDVPHLGYALLQGWEGTWPSRHILSLMAMMHHHTIGVFWGCTPIKPLKMSPTSPTSMRGMMVKWAWHDNKGWGCVFSLWGGDNGHGRSRVVWEVGGDDQWSRVNQRTSSYVTINPTLALAIVVGGGHKETTTSNAHILFVNCSLIDGFVYFIVVLLIHAVLVDFIAEREPNANLLPCTCVLGLLFDFLHNTLHIAA